MELAEALADADDPEATGLVQPHAGPVLREDPRLHRPDAAPLGRGHHRLKQRPPDPAALGLGSHVDAVLGHPGIAAAVRHRDQRCPAHHPTVDPRHQPVLGQMRGVPGRPVGGGRLEGGVAGVDAGLVDGPDRRPVAGSHGLELHGVSLHHRRSIIVNHR
jgi:hypothetical protein